MRSLDRTKLCIVASVFHTGHAIIREGLANHAPSTESSPLTVLVWLMSKDGFYMFEKIERGIIICDTMK